MIIYQNTTCQFVEDSKLNKVADEMRGNFLKLFGRKVSESEYNSWQNSLQHVKNLIEIAGLNDNMIALEYPVPYNTQRIDCLIFGKGKDSSKNVVLIELKQWNKVKELECKGNYEVETFTGGRIRVVSHPSQQVEGYHNHLISFVDAFENDLKLFSCAFCHNYNKKLNEGLFAVYYKRILKKFPIFSKEDINNLGYKLKDLLGKGDGFEIFNRFMTSRIKPSKKLLENAANLIQNKEVFSLLNEQIIAKNIILSKVKKSKNKSVIIVEGGPGTGKSVIALHILAEMAKKRKKVMFGCKSKSFTTALQKKVGKDVKMLFKNLYSFIPSRVKENEFDILIVDEAHRIQKSSNFQYTSKKDRTIMPQIEQLIRCANTCVFFIDNNQNVRGQEIGNTELLREYAKDLGADVEYVKLESQFRCNGSDNYLDWIESILGFNKNKRILRKGDDFEFRIFDSVQFMYDVLKNKELKKENSARVVAGYCWPWSNPMIDGKLVCDVKIGDFKMPWEAREGKKIEKGIPKWYEWAYKTNGINQIGCIYTVQGFEFDYIGVIIGHDIRYDKKNDCLIGNVEGTCDPTLKRNKEDFDQYVKNIYRVLMTRGMKGCYVYFVDKEVEEFFKKRIEGELWTFTP